MINAVMQVDESFKILSKPIYRIDESFTYNEVVKDLYGSNRPLCSYNFIDQHSENLDFIENWLVVSRREEHTKTLVNTPPVYVFGYMERILRNMLQVMEADDKINITIVGGKSIFEQAMPFVRQAIFIQHMNLVDNTLGRLCNFDMYEWYSYKSEKISDFIKVWVYEPRNKHTRGHHV